MDQWLIWAIVLVVQNFSFTFVSRARNSGSLSRHLVASIFSNGVWFVSQMIIVEKLFHLITGEQGFYTAVTVGVFYTVFTCVGALLAHWWALRSEKGKAAVGANKKYAQIPIEEWELAKEHISLLSFKLYPGRPVEGVQK